MGWRIHGNGKYFYRTVKKDGRHVMEYVGSGDEAKKAADEEERNRLERQRRREKSAATQSAFSTNRATAGQAIDAVDWLTNAALIASGFYRHDYGAWRVRHGKNRRCRK